MAIRVNLLIGCTAGGKSRTGIQLARRFEGEILSVDSMKIYRRMDIGTAKPSPELRAEIPHHGIDIVEPSDTFSLADYLDYADKAVRAIDQRDKPVLAVGGTMLYVRGLTAGVFQGPGADPEFRARIRQRAERGGQEKLHAELARIDPEAARRIHPNDIRRIERALEVFHLTGKPISELQTQWEQSSGPYDCRIVALRRPKEEANRRINARVKRMVEAGLVDEVRALISEPRGIGSQAAQAVGYAEIIAHLRGEMPLDKAVEKIKINTRHLAKSQRTWMRRIPGVHFLDIAEDEPVEQIADRVARTWELG
jgi:tRNA dimethylallyltransferase